MSLKKADSNHIFEVEIKNAALLKVHKTIFKKTFKNPKI